MKIKVIPAKELTPEMEEVWAEIQSASGHLRSPFFCPRFIKTLGKYRPDYFSAVFLKDEGIQGFFPFKKEKFGIAKPFFMCDYEAILQRGENNLDIKWLLRECGLTGWEFENLIESQFPLIESPDLEFHVSPSINLKEGFDRYMRWFEGKHPGRMKTLEKTIRKIQRELGPLRVQHGSRDIALIQQLLSWKARRILKNQRWEPWIFETLQDLFAQNSNEPGTLLSELYAGDQLIAIHLGLFKDDILHYWFTSFDEAFHKYSPGALLLLKLAESANSLCFNHIDLGPGGEEYKMNFANEYKKIARGIVEPSCLSSFVRASARSLKKKLRKHSRLYGAMKSLKKAVLQRK